jgi:hypothetical protein
MQAARGLYVVSRVLALGLLVIAFVLAPLTVVPVSADGGGSGNPGIPPDTTRPKSVVDDPTAADETLVTASLYLTVLRFVEL